MEGGVCSGKSRAWSRGLDCFVPMHLGVLFSFLRGLGLSRCPRPCQMPGSRSAVRVSIFGALPISYTSNCVPTKGSLDQNLPVLMAGWEKARRGDG